ncbi:hypothetical protein [Sagittula sp. S175]|uniref:hypothetical protein n=1 Tax=Sagittula sp. S175 TaxID=3415129 RepID=UPI003C7C8244
MSTSSPRVHWSQKFPELRCTDPRLELLRYVLREPESETPLGALHTTLERIFDRALDLNDPGSEERSFDERWLLAIFDALRTVDLRWYQFLLRSRMGAGDAARVHFALTQAQVWLENRL